MNSLQITGLQKSLPEFTLRADFTMTTGERLALRGRSGGGKTSLLKLIAGLETPNGGKILFNDKDITRLSPERRNIGFIFQNQALFQTLNVLDNVTFGLRMRGVSKKERESLGLSWLDKFGLSSHARRSIENLSGGEKQRIAFLRAFIWKPDILLLDEPFTALDEVSLKTLQNELLVLHREWPAPLIFVSHRLEDIEKIATDEINLDETKTDRVFARK